MKSIYSTTITKNGKNLALFCTSFKTEQDISFTKEFAISIWSELAPYAKNKVHALYVRDIKSYSIQSKYPGGHTYNQWESMVALPSWKTPKKQIYSTFAHELHHLVRWQNAGYGESLGEAILSEGLASYYETIKTGWIPPWGQVKITKQDTDAAVKEWGNEDYNHVQWFFGDGMKNWLGYSIGYQMAKAIYKDSFELKNSLEITAKEAQKYIK